MDNNQDAISSNELVNATSNEVLFENIIENIINNYVDNNQPTQPTQPINIQQNNTNQNNNQQYVENMSMLHALRDVLVGYNTNMREYQENIRNFLNIIHITQNVTNMNSREHAHQPQPQPQRQSTRNSTNIPYRMPSNGRTTFNVTPLQTAPRNPLNNRPIIQPLSQTTREQQPFQQLFTSFLNIDRNRTLNTGFVNHFRDVVVYPSQGQITNATRNIEFSDSSANMNTSCPITLDEFQNGDIVRQIIPCGHIFQESALRNWFTRNVRCPVCRYDIRDYIPNNISSINSDISNNSSTINGINGIDYNTETDTDSDDDVGPSFSNINQPNHPNPQNTPISQRTTNAANNVNRIVNNIINSTTRTLDEMLTSYMSNYADTSDNLIYRVEIPLYYNEYYDASDNYIGTGDLIPDYD
jgi:hypothetical protein